MNDNEQEEIGSQEYDENHNFFAEHGIPNADERFRVYKMFRTIYDGDRKGFPSFYDGYQLGYSDSYDISDLLELAVKAVCYVAESMPEDDQNLLAGRLFQLLPKIILKEETSC